MASPTISNTLFFEVIAEFESFAVLSSIDRLNVKKSSDGGYYQNSPGTAPAYHEPRAIVEQTETIYFMSATGDLLPYMSLIQRKNDAWRRAEKQRTKDMDKDLFKEYFPEPAYSSIMKYAKENDLSVKVKEDLIKILAYYKGNNK